MKITLKDGSNKEYAQPISIYEIAADISEGLARAACAGEVVEGRRFKDGHRQRLLPEYPDGK